MTRGPFEFMWPPFQPSDPISLQKKQGDRIRPNAERLLDE